MQIQAHFGQLVAQKGHSFEKFYASLAHNQKSNIPLMMLDFKFLVRLLTIRKIDQI